MLTEQEKKAVDDFAKKIDITDTNLVLNYGVAAQKSVATFSENALSSVRNKDLGEVGETLSNLVVEVKGFGQEEEEGLRRPVPQAEGQARADARAVRQGRDEREPHCF